MSKICEICKITKCHFAGHCVCFDDNCQNYCCLDCWVVQKKVLCEDIEVHRIMSHIDNKEISVEEIKKYLMLLRMERQ
jgi:hypothetical protein